MAFPFIQKRPGKHHLSRSFFNMLSTKSPAIQKWIDQYISDNPPRAKSVVMTVFGDTITPHGGEVWLGSLIELLAPLGINDRLVRTSVFRLAAEDWLEARREGRRSLYALTGSGLRRFERAFQRIYFPSVQWQGAWTIVMATAENLGAAQRGTLRKELLWEGFGVVAPGVFAHPGGKADSLEEILERVGVSGKVFVCSASPSSMAGARPLSDLIAHAWQLDSVVERYRGFIQQFDMLPTLIRKKASLDPEQAFAIRTLLIHAFRRVQLHDPQFPPELLPADWPGTTAYELCAQIYQSVCPDAERFVAATLQREDEQAGVASEDFYLRFGALPATGNAVPERLAAASAGG